MKVFKRLMIFVCVLWGTVSSSLCAFSADTTDNGPVSTKKERNHITKGNDYYNKGDYRQALTQYQLALKENPASVVGKYNLGLSEIRIGSNPNDTSQTAKNMLESGVNALQQIANMGERRPGLSSRANYNLGNVAFNSQDYSNAVNYYKQALRLNPDDNDARRNLRIAQLKIQQQEQNQDQNQDQDQEQQDQNKDQNQDQQEQNQDQNQDQQDQNQDQQDRQQEQNQAPSIDNQTAEQILNAIENKENHTRAKVAGTNAEKSRQRNRNRLNW